MTASPDLDAEAAQPWRRELKEMAWCGDTRGRVSTVRPQFVKGKKGKRFLWPIPPLCKSGVPKGIVNADTSNDSGAAWLPSARSSGLSETTPLSLALPEGPRPASARPGSARFFSRPSSARARSGSTEASAVTNLLEALGIPSMQAKREAGEETIASSSRKRGELPAFKLKDPQQCEEGCYWRWLVHSLLEDVASLKKKLEESQESCQQIEERKKRIEDTISQRIRLDEELTTMKQALSTLRQDVPRLRQELDKAEKAVDKGSKKYAHLQEQQHHLLEKIKQSQEWQKANIRKVPNLERSAEDLRLEEQLLGDKVHVEKERAELSKLELDEMQGELQELQLEVRELEKKKSAKQRAGKKGGKK